MKNAFKTKYRLHEWFAMSLDLSNSPNPYIRFMREDLRPFIVKFVIVYFDDSFGV